LNGSRWRNVGITQTKATYIAPIKVILPRILSMYSDVFLPGLIPGIKPPFFLRFSAKSSGELMCIEASTGKMVWESNKVTDLINGASIHLTPNGDTVLLYTDKGELIRAQLTSQGYNEISRVAVLEPTFPFAGRNVVWSPPAYANRHIFARNGKELICASLAAKP